MSQTFVISLGGSIVAPKAGIDVPFLKKLRTFLKGRVAKGDRFVIITGGGAVCRDYQAAARKAVKATKEDLDWIGISTTYINAEILRVALGNLAHPKVYRHEGILRVSKKYPVKLAGGYKPGRSSDGASIRVARKVGAKMLINLSNIDYAYDRDPRKYEAAKKIESISWTDFRKIVGNRWDPGMSAPFDPTASKMAQVSSISVAIANGHDLKNLGRILDGKSFKGTLIS